MNEHFSRYLAVRTLDRELHARRFAAGLTAHDFDAVVRAAEDCWDAHDEWLAAYAAHSDLLDAHVTAEDRRYPAWERYAPEWVQRLIAVAADGHESAPALGQPLGGFRGNSVGGRLEAYPITRWAKDARRYRAAARKLQKALEVAAEHVEVAAAAIK